MKAKKITWQEVNARTGDMVGKDIETESEGIVRGPIRSILIDFNKDAAIFVLDWIMGLHFLSFQYDIIQFSLGTAVLLIIATGVIGYIVGYVFGALWNWIHGAAHTVQKP